MKCKRCNGSKRMKTPSSHDGTAACVTCDATGQAVTCPECDGEGKDEQGNPCRVCDGWGQVPARVASAAAAGEDEGEGEGED